ncbi:MAG: hypothetical protein JWO36_4091 [Myxococcales bacterium]|nr:hypothetical protein [Myxococcales bacterium]
MRARIVYGLLVIATSVVVALTIKLERARSESKALAEEHLEFCSKVKLSIHDDRLAFLSGNLQRQERALDRFFEGPVMYHNADSLLICISDLPELPLFCQLNKDWACLARFAQSIEDLLDRVSR